MESLARKLQWWTVPLLGLIWGPAVAAAAQLRELDLALTPPGTIATRPARPGEYSFILKNTVNRASYSVTVERELVPIAALVSPFATPKAPVDAEPPKPESCEELIGDFETAMDSAPSETSETKVKEIVDGIQKDPTALELCVAKAEAAKAVAIAQCAVDELKRAEAEKAAAAAQKKVKDAAAKLKEKKDACLKAADDTEANKKANCPPTPKEAKEKCEKAAAKEASDARVKCLKDFGD